ncbi:uncharacterized protein PGTG_06039 [Puccinia graminis f. sp. tritici CRL 75-36-700-3]|uniref:AB hydrolase-1 domain-containing protein n=1 Tax=Puccinia graminis f. sp. tritici (strain CRL 75-36-700-3 / race SCCL) TaxID=418459 RepID=E3K5C2_PUCGT|nr:uncharacterized protein PGTG_06039 [Puccinia graminis f. sp. tritici CRL 75-36-700-3]EFP79718.2 hypothetical protein PGTG_06039 [Puccinia graminis f. sp. tritici CRL 75-36-700-3]
MDSSFERPEKTTSGWNSLLGAIRTHSSLPDDFREILILRVAALNSAPYEWIQHEKVGRSAGLTTPQLMRIRDIIKPLTDTLDRSHVVLSDLHLAGLAFTDSLTREIQVRDLTFDKLKNEFSRLGNEPEQVTKMLFDAAATVSGYNMVSRMLVGLEIGDDRDDSVDLPGLETRFEKLVMRDGTRLNSGVPTTDCTLNQLADDVSAIVEQLGLQTPLHGLIGVSQGGATTLEMSTRSPHLFKHYVVCDTQPSSPSGARDVWKTRIDLAEGSEDGFKKLSEATISRWFPIESHMNQPNNQTSTCIRRMIEETDLGGFESGAAALYDYQVDEDRIPCDEHQKVLLLAGERDGSLPQVLEALSRRLNKAGKPVKFMTVPGAGHLPMVDQPLKFLNILEPFLDN